VKTQTTPTSLWTVAASADTAEQLAAAIERAQLAHPGAELRVDQYTKGGERIEGTPLAALEAAA